ncbi:hypothetical protein GC194_15685 [bacterium]|nr:hypothetical protein [bacterium]
MAAAIKKYGFVALLALAVLLVYVQQLFGVFTEPKLPNGPQKTNYSSPDFVGVASGKWQQQTNEYLRFHFGFFNSLLLNYSQFDFSLFRRAHARNVVIGKEDYMYEKDYIDALYGYNLVSDSALETNMHKLQKVYEALQQHQTQLLVVLAPGKASYFPEYIPDRLKPKHRVYRNNVSVFDSALQKVHIPTLNLNRWFIEQKGKTHFPLMAKTGIHWTVFGMGQAIDTIIKTSEFLSHKSLGHIQYNKIDSSTKAQSTDDDLERGMNLMFPVNDELLGYPQYYYSPAKDTAKALLIADSYGMGMLRQGMLDSAFTDGQFWFYYKMHFTRANANSEKVRYLDRLKEFNQSDIIILLATEATLHRFFYGFIDDAYELYYPDDEEVQAKNAEIETIMRQIESNNEAMQRLAEKAKREKQAVELMVRTEAEYIYRVNHGLE